MITTQQGTIPDPVQARSKGSRKRRRKRQHSFTPANGRSLFASRWGDVLLACSLFLVALIIRWPYPLRLPHFTDETVELEWSMAIWRGEIFPLTASDRYYGPLHLRARR